MDYRQVFELEDLLKELRDKDAVLIYFSAPGCNVCKVLKPKLAELLTEKFPKIQRLYVDIEKSPLIAGQFTVFSIPTILIFFEGKEFIRESRNIGLNQLNTTLGRPYSLLFP